MGLASSVTARVPLQCLSTKEIRCCSGFSLKGYQNTRPIVFESRNCSPTNKDSLIFPPSTHADQCFRRVDHGAATATGWSFTRFCVLLTVPFRFWIIL